MNTVTWLLLGGALIAGVVWWQRQKQRQLKQEQEEAAAEAVREAEQRQRRAEEAARYAQEEERRQAEKAREAEERAAREAALRTSLADVHVRLIGRTSNHRRSTDRDALRSYLFGVGRQTEPVTQGERLRELFRFYPWGRPRYGQRTRSKAVEVSGLTRPEAAFALKAQEVEQLESTVLLWTDEHSVLHVMVRIHAPGSGSVRQYVHVSYTQMRMPEEPKALRVGTFRRTELFLWIWSGASDVDLPDPASDAADMTRATFEESWTSAALGSYGPRGTTTPAPALPAPGQRQLPAPAGPEVREIRPRQIGGPTRDHSGPEVIDAEFVED